MRLKIITYTKICAANKVPKVSSSANTDQKSNNYSIHEQGTKHPVRVGDFLTYAPMQLNRNHGTSALRNAVAATFKPLEDSHPCHHEMANSGLIWKPQSYLVILLHHREIMVRIDVY